MARKEKVQRVHGEGNTPRRLPGRRLGRGSNNKQPPLGIPGSRLGPIIKRPRKKKS